LSKLAFLSPDLASAEASSASPLAAALRDVGGFTFRDLTLETAQIEVRGDLDGLDAIRLSPRRALVICPAQEAAAARASLAGRFFVDLSAAYAGVRIEGEEAETLLRRLTDLDLGTLPAVAKVIETPALVRRDGAAFEIFFPQEFGRYFAETLVDLAEGIA
jgi:heterotetrameric sarcosine oxidase gamma subunit